MSNQQIILDALAEKIARLEQKNLDTVREWDNKNSETASRYLSHINCFIHSVSVDIDGFLHEKRRQYSTTTVDERANFIKDTLDIVEYLHEEVEDQRLLDFYEEFSKMVHT